jgi:pimeloyl-ACP methyl ester carboxylesterase
VATYALLHGAGSESWYWHLVGPLLRDRGHEVVAPDLPSDDDRARLSDYVDVSVDAIGDRRDVIFVAQSLSGFIAPLASERVSTELIVLVAAMVPSPGESAGEWWTNSGFYDAKRAQSDGDKTTPGEHFDPEYTFLHDVPKDVFADGETHVRQQSGTIFEDPWPLDRWPDVPTKFVLCRDDRFFPADFMRRVVKERLGITPDEIDSGHLPALSHPSELVERFEAYRAEFGG